MKRTVLVVGNGAREHALCWKLAQAESVGRLLAVPGNPGIGQLAELIPFSPMDVDSIVEVAIAEHVDLVVIGPEAPLSVGLADALRASGVATFGPSQDAAQIESSKSWAKELMERANVPTAWYTIAEDLFTAMATLQKHPMPVVIKADGLAAGKGVVVAESYDEAVMAVTAMIEERSLGDSGARVLIEECLVGEEVSVFAITDGTNVVMLPPSCDHKRAFDGDKGPNTGGMGAYAPTSLVDDAMLEQIRLTIIQPTIDAMRTSGTPFIGVLYAGLMMTASGPRVIEFNARFGDPEAQVVLPLLDGDLGDLLFAAATGTMAESTIRWDHNRYMVGVVAAAGGYPGPFARGTTISGIPDAEANAIVFQAGTTSGPESTIVTNGGRILTVVGEGATMAEAKLQAYAGIEAIHIDGAFYRRDIGYREPDA